MRLPVKEVGCRRRGRSLPGRRSRQPEKVRREERKKEGTKTADGTGEEEGHSAFPGPVPISQRGLGSAELAEVRPQPRSTHPKVQSHEEKIVSGYSTLRDPIRLHSGQALVASCEIEFFSCKDLGCVGRII